VSAHQAQDRPVGQRGLSEDLRRFTEQLPYERGTILDFVSHVALSATPHSAVLDVGAGDSPYRELFAHTRYTTSDWSESLHPGGRHADIIAPADDLPVEDGTFDLVLCTQVLEHVPEPSAVLAECFRVLVPAGRFAVTVPLLWELHELPHDYYRYTESGLRYLLTRAGFTELRIEARGSGFEAVAQLISNLGWSIGDADDGLSEDRLTARAVLSELATQLAALAPLEVERVMPLGYSATARRP
jgi:SAM-dependent methyltransferase